MKDTLRAIKMSFICALGFIVQFEFWINELRVSRLTGISNINILFVIIAVLDFIVLTLVILGWLFAFVFPITNPDDKGTAVMGMIMVVMILVYSLYIWLLNYLSKSRRQ